MKRYPVLILLSVIIISLLSECAKYDEGPTISFHSRQKRIEGLWKVDKFLVTEKDSTSFYTALFGDKIDIPVDEYTWEMPEGSGSMRMGGTWEWHTLKYYVMWNVDYAYINNVYFQTDTISFYGMGPFSTNHSIKWEIERISSKELFLSTVWNNNEYRLEMKIDQDY